MVICVKIGVLKQILSFLYALLIAGGQRSIEVADPPIPIAKAREPGKQRIADCANIDDVSAGSGRYSAPTQPAARARVTSSS